MDTWGRSIFFVCVCLFRAIPAAYGSSWARGRIGGVAVGLHHSHSNARSEPHLQPQQCWILNLLSKVPSSWILVRFVSHWAMMGTPFFCCSFFKVLLTSSWSTRLWSCLMCNKGIQLYMDTLPFSFRFFSHRDYHRILVECHIYAIQQVPIGQSCRIPQCACANPKLPVHPSPTLTCPFW